MHSIFFDNFLKEFNSTGREKADGYTLVNFDKMPEDERKIAFNLLSQELEKSSIAIDPISYIDNNNAHSLFIKKYLEQKKIGHVNFHLVAKIWHHERSDFYVDEFVKCYESLNKTSMISYINDAEKIHHEKTTSLLIKIIINSDQEYIRRHAAHQLLKRTNNLDVPTKEKIIENLSTKEICEREEIIHKLKESTEI